uniref:GPI mannosyltransferase 1 n=1 Tax=Pyramimonas obovata TaxID=1411642 RepID=A0A7S0RXY5_9CHLO|mmetsp:Transcript_9561/g.19806  ORF Transcript_9561/g.19806 Transcript_9561/m.19806 type:complete len:408 (+) Transcript_9561:69-1292(+)
MRLTPLLVLAGGLRAALILYGEWQDANLAVKYTDIDYTVFSDAARLVSQGGSPYDRDTYRYTPLLAFALLPNIHVHPAWGKVLFSICDLCVGWLAYTILCMRGCTPRTAAKYTAMWLFNPFTVPIGTRGNCEALVSALLLSVLHSLMHGRIYLAAVVYGVAVHTRIYPIIYALPILLFLNEDYPPCSRRWFSRNRIVFSVVSATVFVVLFGGCYALYGRMFLDEAFLYHVTRSDPRHNFSVKFYSIYLHHADFSPSTLKAILGFLPQMLVLVTLSIKFARDLPFCFFMETFAFVAFNKVCTAQYFVWFFAFLPLVLPSLSPLTLGSPATVALGVWGLTQVHWLAWAYALEFKGWHVFLPLWGASVLFLLGNIGVLCTLIRDYRCSPVFAGGKACSLRNVAGSSSKNK